VARWLWLFAMLGCAARPLVITDVAIVDVVRGETTGPRTIVIRDGRIAAIGAEVRIPDDADRLDGRGRYVVPGLIDMHVHLFAGGGRTNAWALAWFVAAGVTTVRDMAARPAELAGLRGRGPRIVAGVAVGGAPAEATARVDAAADAGADFVKVFSELAEPSWRAVLAAARRRGLAVIGHVPAGVALLDAARAGQRGAEHLMQAFEACTADEPGWLAGRAGLAGDALVARRDADEPAVLAAFDPVACARVAAALAALGQVQDPTLVLAWTDARDADPARDPRWRALPAGERARWTRLLAQRSPAERAVAPRRWAVARQIAAAFARAGVVIVAGTDAPMPRVYPGFALHDELAALVAAGLAPADALRAATSTAARVLGRADLGEIAVGKRADLVILDGDPLRDIAQLRRIHAVIVAGATSRRRADRRRTGAARRRRRARARWRRRARGSAPSWRSRSCRRCRSGGGSRGGSP
jgi:imidazolonepropionase-like amidohydrolase